MDAEFRIVNLRDEPARKEQMAAWFHDKWGIPQEAYLESMDACLKGEGPVPQWYGVMQGGEMIGGLGVIENDFHDRTDLTPNVCAVYVEKAHRNCGVAGGMLNHVCDDMRAQGVSTLYLLTDHTGFYERYGWEFFCLAQGDGESEPSRMYVHRSK